MEEKKIIERIRDAFEEIRKEKERIGEVYLKLNDKYLYGQVTGLGKAEEILKKKLGDLLK